MTREKISQTVSERFEHRRQEAELAAKQRKKELHQRIPELAELDRERSGVAARLLETVFQGEAGLDARIERIREHQRDLQKKRVALLLKNGFPADYDKPRRQCALCQDEGFIDGKMCRCMRREIVLEGYRESGMGRLLERQRFDNFKLSLYDDQPLPGKTFSPRRVMEQIYGTCKDWADNFSLNAPSLLLLGGTGLGKTHLSTAMAGKVIEKGYNVVYLSVPSMLSQAEKERFRSEDENEESVTRRMLEAELLILDDLGAEPASKLAASLIYTVVNERTLVRGLPTIINTNLDAAHLERQYDSAVLSRLLGDFEVMQFIGTDLRLSRKLT